ncbi:replicative DNA helicase [Paenibacillus sp. MMS20-IR301]|uniref:replicative DNA helicase n=1 Tax=Paenibacillus sp. MMS20-IR301 TaxID=2895946 RepID=UPI0028E55BD2|nr:replicative DNA helicase [Paenibacillus sp. MMS20-IR301]WNS40848.1 replicative DNA helicase [Paenibacillus sp. MMS20-IR301]
MDRFELEGALSGFQERMSKVALFDPLFELQRKKQTDANGQPIDMMELGLLTLLFFFEQKLVRNSKAGAKDLALYLLRIMDDKLQVDSAKGEELARDIIQIFRPASGKKREFSFFNWESRERQTVYTSILRANAFDVKSNTQYYALDEDGLELVFATKEFYSEFQLSIHQLVLRKQLEKGEFQGALRQINEMRVDVESLQERMLKLEHEIKRSIVSEETLKRYSGLLDDIYTRLQRENDEFAELRQFVKETRTRLYADNNPDKQGRAYEYILRIASELEKVHAEHSGLLQKSMDLKNQALYSAKESLYYTGLSSFNFEQDVAGVVLGLPLPLESMRGIVSPFMGLGQSRVWSPLTLFAEQNVTGTGELEPREEGFLEAADEQSGLQFTLQRGAFFAEIMELLIQELDKGPELELRLFIERLSDYGCQDWLQRRSFYDFMLILHQRSPVRPSSADVSEEKSGLDKVFGLLGGRVLLVEEAAGLAMAGARYQIQNMKLKWEDR